MIKVKEMKEDALVQVTVNRGYYMMVKNTAYILLDKLIKAGKPEEYLKEIGNKPYNDLDEDQRSLHTITLLVAEIESQAVANNQFTEKEILEPGDEGYVAPNLD